MDLPRSQMRRGGYQETGWSREDKAPGANKKMVRSFCTLVQQMRVKERGVAKEGQHA